MFTISVTFGDIDVATPEEAARLFPLIMRDYLDGGVQGPLYVEVKELGISIAVMPFEIAEAEDIPADAVSTFNQKGGA